MTNAVYTMTVRALAGVVSERAAETMVRSVLREQNLLPDETGKPVRHPQIPEMFERTSDGGYKLRLRGLN